MQAQHGILLASCHWNMHQTSLEMCAAAYIYSLFKVSCFVVGVPTLKHISLEHLHCKAFHLQAPLILQHKKAKELQSTSWSGLTGDPQATSNAMLNK